MRVRLPQLWCWPSHSCWRLRQPVGGQSPGDATLDGERGAEQGPPLQVGDKPGFDATAAPGGSQERRVDEDPAGNPCVAGELLITYKEGVSATSEATIFQRAEGKILATLPEIDARHISFPEIKAEDSEEVREEALEEKENDLEQNPKVEAADYNYIRKAHATPNDQYFSLQWGLPRINATQAWDVTKRNGTSIAVVDTGTDQTHPEFGGPQDTSPERLREQRQRGQRRERRCGDRLGDHRASGRRDQPIARRLSTVDGD